MKIYLNPPQPSRGLQRIADALVRHRPSSAEVVNSTDDADLVILYAIGRCEQLTAEAQRLRSRKQQYAVVQCCIRSTQKPSTKHWLDLWRDAWCVWSYYDLVRMVVDDLHAGELDDYRGYWVYDNFYHAPLGADAATFFPRETLRRHVVVTTGLSYLSESVRECWLAAQASFKAAAHLGPVRPRGHRVESFNDLTDDEVAQLYSSAKFVSGLRRKEGFELPAVEGLLCGSRPILFDTPDYRHWYEPWGVFIGETSRDNVVRQLTQVFLSKYQPVTTEEIEAARERFNWERIIGGFYERIS